MEVLVYVAHVDDEIVGCGGTIAKLAREHVVHVVYANTGIVFHKGPGKSLRDDAFKSGKLLGIEPNNIHFLDLPTMEFDIHGHLKLNKCIEKLGLDPDLVITHSGYDDINVDHAAVFASARVQARPLNKPRSLISFEIGSHSNWFMPNTYVDITETLLLKLGAMECIISEIRDYPHPRSKKFVIVQAMVRGVECGCKYAEAFVAERIML